MSGGGEVDEPTCAVLGLSFGHHPQVAVLIRFEVDPEADAEPFGEVCAFELGSKVRGECGLEGFAGLGGHRCPLKRKKAPTGVRAFRFVEVGCAMVGPDSALSV